MSLDLNALLEQAQKLQAEMQKTQDRLAEKTVTGSAAGGMVIVTANGKGEILKVQIDPKAVDAKDVPMLEDLVLAAVHSAVRAAQELAAAENPLASVQGMLGGAGFPPGFGP